MLKVNNDNIIAFDVDDTLITFENKENCELIEISSLDGRYKDYARPLKKHIDMVKNSKVRGHYVVVWSQGGVNWAEAVVKALHLEEFVDLIMCKPSWLVDDIPPNEWTVRLYKEKL